MPVHPSRKIFGPLNRNCRGQFQPVIARQARRLARDCVERMLLGLRCGGARGQVRCVHRFLLRIVVFAESRRLRPSVARSVHNRQVKIGKLRSKQAACRDSNLNRDNRRKNRFEKGLRFGPVVRSNISDVLSSCNQVATCQQGWQFDSIGRFIDH